MSGWYYVCVNTNGTNSVTKKMVAEVAGVSHMTVTRVLADYPYVREETRERVLTACKQLDYHPNIIAAGLAGGRTNAIGVIVPTFKHAFFSRLLNTVERDCKRLKYHIVTIQAIEKDGNVKVNPEDIDFLLARQVDGLLVCLSMPAADLDKIARHNTAVVFVDNPPQAEGFSFVGTADFEGSRELTDYLIKAGHKEIAFLAGHKLGHTSNDRVAGYARALQDNGLAFHDELVTYTNYHMEGGYDGMIRLLDKGIHFTAAMGMNDYVAIGAMSACHHRGIRVPEEVSIAGFTGDDLGAYVNPTLTTMVQPIEEIASQALKLLFKHINNPDYPAIMMRLPAKFQERRSVTQRK